MRDYNDTTGEYGIVTNGRFNRLCSAFLAGPPVGLTTWAFMTGEETNANNTLDGVAGGQSFAVINGTAHALPRLGRFAKENQIVLRETGIKTVIVALDDSGPSQIYVYVGQKTHLPLGPLSRNGLDNGSLYVLKVAELASENDLVKGESAPFDLIEVDWSQDEPALRAEAAAVGALNFVRIEDGCQDLNDEDVFYFCTTGGPGTGNTNGRLIKLDFNNVRNPKNGGTIEVLLDGSEGMVSPDNMDINSHGQLLIQEDPTYTLVGRDSSVWLYNVNDAGLSRVVEVDTEVAQSLDPPYTLGRWETSGVIDASGILGEGWWLLDVQAAFNLADPELVRGGQILAVKIAVN